MIRALRIARRMLDLALFLLVGSVVVLVLAVNMGPSFGHRVVVIRGSSMSPAIPLGSAVDVVAVDPAEIRPGDVVMLKDPSGTVITHRVLQLVDNAGGLYLETKGDANEKADGIVPATYVTGRVEMSLPIVGYLLFLLTLPSGVMSILSLALTLFLGAMLLEDFEIELAEERAARRSPIPAPGPAA
jgi:signal peptidase I